MLRCYVEGTSVRFMQQGTEPPDNRSNRGPNKENPLKENGRFIVQLLVALREKHIRPHWCATVHDTAL
ncbi:hypothetical protein N7524_011440 [Penicillium chrysogenum]|nr:hypothetical protein N7524_011440 [Penicillium chrysogenum]